MKLYLCEKTSLKTYFHKLKSRVVVTTDTWSIQNLNYLCLIAHFIDDDWKLHKRIINFVVMPSYKGKDIRKMVEKCIYEWGIEKKVSTITVNNTSLNDVAISFLKEKLSRDKLSTHILNLIVRDGLTKACDFIAHI